MASADFATTVISDSEHKVQLRRAVVAATIGTAIEWYDFFLYSTVTGLVFAKLYFPNSDPWIGTLEAFGIYAVGFIARPIGAAIFGHYGDRIGRKSTLIATLLLMGVATFAVALVPTYERIGIWGAVLLTILRFIQGVGVGGEWGGSVLLAMEWSRTNHSRGFIASWPQFGVPCGLFLANLAVLAFSQLSCRIARMRTYLIAGGTAGIFRSRQWWGLATVAAAVVVIPSLVSGVPPAIMYGPPPALPAGRFPRRPPDSVASPGHQPAGIIA